MQKSYQQYSLAGQQSSSDYSRKEQCHFMMRSFCSSQSTGRCPCLCWLLVTTAPHNFASATQLASCLHRILAPSEFRFTAGLDRVMQFYLQSITECYNCGSDRGPEQPATLCHIAQSFEQQLEQNTKKQWRQLTLGKAMPVTSFTATKCQSCKPR